MAIAETRSVAGGWVHRGSGEEIEADLLSADDYRRILAVLAHVEPALDITTFKRLALEALDQHLGCNATFIVGNPPDVNFQVAGPPMNELGARDRARLTALRPHLAHLMRTLVTNGNGASKQHDLSRREREVAVLVAQGCSNREIARHLGIQEDTVKKHLWHVMRRLKVRNRTQVALHLA